MAVYFSGVKIFNSLSLKVKEISHDPKKFKSRLKNFLIHTPLTLLTSFLADKKCKLCLGYL
jgi:hypothetical protein